MQTFLPYPSFERSARCLDWRRLGKQRLEARQILRALQHGSGGWFNHPAVRMWLGFEPALVSYGNVMIIEWSQRGYHNTMELLTVMGLEQPPWLGMEKLHASHRSNLLRKDPEWYAQFGWLEGPELPYYWPVA
jgi:hypothetical protein